MRPGFDIYPIFHWKDRDVVTALYQKLKEQNEPGYFPLDGLNPEGEFNEPQAVNTAVVLVFCIGEGFALSPDMETQMTQVKNENALVVAVTDLKGTVPLEVAKVAVTTLCYEKSSFLPKLSLIYEYAYDRLKVRDEKQRLNEGYDLFRYLHDGPDLCLKRDPDLRVPIAVTETGPIECDLREIKDLLVYGRGKVGKTTLMSYMIATLTVRNDPDMVRLALIDPVGDLFDFGRLHALYMPRAHKQQEIWDTIYSIEEEVHQRANKLDEWKLGATIEEWNQAHEEKMPYIVCFVDALERSKMEDGAGIVAKKSKGTGVFFICTCNRESPEYDYPAKLHVRDKMGDIVLYYNGEKKVGRRLYANKFDLKWAMEDYSQTPESIDEFDELVQIAKKRDYVTIETIMEDFKEMGNEIELPGAYISLYFMKSFELVEMRREVDKGYRVIMKRE